MNERPDSGANRLWHSDSASSLSANYAPELAPCRLVRSSRNHRAPELAVFLLLIVLFAYYSNLFALAQPERITIAPTNHTDLELRASEIQHRRLLLSPGSSSSSSSSSSAAAAAESSGKNVSRLAVRRHRFDPLRRFKKYKGGYDLRSKHYWASTIFTGVPGYVIGVSWLVIGFAACIIGGVCHGIRLYDATRKPLGGVYGGGSKHGRDFDAHQLPNNKGDSNGRRRERDNGDLDTYPVSNKKGCSNGSLQEERSPLLTKCGRLLVPLILATLLFTTLALACCGVVVVGNQRFHKAAKIIERTIILQGAERATEDVQNVTTLMGQMRADIQPYDKSVAQRLDNTSTQLHNAALDLMQIVHSHKGLIDKALRVINIGVAALATLNMLIWLAGFACFHVFFGYKRCLYWVLALAWLLILVNWVSFGIVFALNNFSDDTCKALDQYQQQNSRNTTLDNVLPCQGLAAGNKTVLRLRKDIYNYIEKANANISKLNHNRDTLVVELQGFYNDAIPRVCNPFAGPPSYFPKEKCMDGTISIGTLPSILTMLKCPTADLKDVNSSGSCIPAKEFGIATAYINATEKLLDLLPQMQSLIDCSFLIDTFSIIVQKQCKPFKTSIRMVWVGMAVLSALSVSIFFLWWLRLFLTYPKPRFAKSMSIQRGAILPHEHPTS